MCRLFGHSASQREISPEFRGCSADAVALGIGMTLITTLGYLIGATVASIFNKSTEDCLDFYGPLGAALFFMIATFGLMVDHYISDKKQFHRAESMPEQVLSPI